LEKAVFPSQEVIPVELVTIHQPVSRGYYDQGRSINGGRTMQIENVYRPGPVICQRTDSLAKAARRMRAEQVGALAVCDDDRLDQLVDVLSERDIVQAVADSTDMDTTPVPAYASFGVHTANPKDDTAVIADRMLNLEIRHIPVTRDGAVLGMVSMRDLLAFEAWTS
jgi:CBS domain-containing protein